MAAIDITDEALIRATPQQVFDEIMRLMAGQAHWWQPHLEVRAVGGQAPGRVGSLSQISIPGRACFVARIVQVEAPNQFAVEYIEGDFRGSGLWRFEAVPGGTRISLRWQPQPTRWLLRVLSKIVARSHSRVMALGFSALDAHLNSAGKAAA